MVTLLQPPAAFNYQDKPIYIRLTTDVTGQENHTCFLEVYEVDGVDENLIVTLDAPFDTDQETAFDLMDLFNVAPGLPSRSSINYNAGLGFQFGVATSMFVTFRIKYGDKYGTPPVQQTPVVSSDYLAVKGAPTLDNYVFIEQLPADVFGLHAYHSGFNPLPVTFYKPIKKTQPDWHYISCGADGDYDVVIDLYYTDGTTSTHTIDTITLSEKNIYWMQSGYNQLNIDAIKTPDLVVDHYAFTVRKTGEMTAKTRIDYILSDTCQEWEDFYIYFNGLGGMETFAATGINDHNHDVARDTLQTTRGNLWTAESGEFSQFNQRGYKSKVLRTDFIPAEYAEHLRAALHGQVWRVRDDIERFDKMLHISSSEAIRTDDADLSAFSMAVRDAWTDRFYSKY